MAINIQTRGRDNQYEANGKYENGVFVVLKGSRLALLKAKTQVPDYVKKLRNDETYVNERSEVIKDCIFTSASHAALFVTGNVSNGLRVWKTEDGKGLRDSIK